MPISDMFSGLGDWIKTNPEQFAIMSDMLGSNIAPAPYNPFSGIGMNFGQSSLANKSLQEQRVERERMMEMMRQYLGGGGAVQPEAMSSGNAGPLRSNVPQQKDMFQNPEDILTGALKNMTPVGAPGVGGFKVTAGKTGPDGTVSNPTMSINYDLPGSKKDQTASLGDMFSGPF